MTTEKVRGVFLWMLKEIKTMSYGEIHVVLKVHDGKIAYIERSKTLKEKPEL